MFREFDHRRATEETMTMSQESDRGHRIDGTCLEVFLGPVLPALSDVVIVIDAHDRVAFRPPEKSVVGGGGERRVCAGVDGRHRTVDVLAGREGRGALDENENLRLVSPASEIVQSVEKGGLGAR